MQQESTTMEHQELNGHEVPTAQPTETLTESQLEQYSELQPSHGKGWTDLDKAYVLKHWRLEDTQDARDSNRKVSQYVGRTRAATYQMYHHLTSGRDKLKTTVRQVKTPRGTHRMIGAYSPHLTREEEQVILETFGGFTPDMKAIVLALRHYERPKTIYMDHEAGKLVIDFYPKKD